MKLQEQALLYESGELDLLNDAIMEKEMIEQRNKILVPIYIELTSMIKHYQNNEISDLNQDLRDALVKLYKKYDEESQDFLS